MALPEEVTGQELADLLGLTPRRVQQLAAEGVVAKAKHGTYALRPSVQGYLDSIRISPDGENLEAAQARVATARADKLEMENDRLRGVLLPKADVAAAVQAAFARVRARLLGIPAKASPLLFGAKAIAVIQDKLTELVHEALAELASTRVVPVSEDPDRGSDGTGDEGLVASPDAPAEADGQRVGGRQPDAQPGGKRRARPVED